MFNVKKHLPIYRKLKPCKPITPTNPSEILPFIKPVSGLSIEQANWWHVPLALTHKDAQRFGSEYAHLLAHYMRTSQDLNSLFWCIRDMPRGQLLGELEKKFLKEIAYYILN